jgi:hypothetical protein
LPVPVRREKSTLDMFYRNPTLANYRRLKRELAMWGLSVEQVFPDLDDFLAWKGRNHLYLRIMEIQERRAY